MMFKGKRYTGLAWGLLHFVNDWTAGYIITSFSSEHAIEITSVALLVYTILAFGGQLPAGILLDKHKALGTFVNMSIGLLIASLICYLFNDWVAIIIAGFSSALLHVTGGRICLEVSRGKAGQLGLFTAPGVLGLALGIASASQNKWWILFPLIFIFVVILAFDIRFRQRISNGKLIPSNRPAVKAVKGHDWLMIVILLTVSLRSLLYEIINSFAGNWQDGLLVIGISAFAGKIIGGFLADKIGWRLWVYITLPLAFLLLQLGKGNLVMLSCGIACLQSSVPISLLLMQRSMPEFPATAVGLTLGTAISFAALSFFILDKVRFAEGWFSEIGFIIGSGIIFSVLIYLIFKKRHLT